MPTNLLLLPLLGGYWFVHRCFYFRFRAQGHDGYRLLIESALAGVVLTFLSRVLIVAIRPFPVHSSIQWAWTQFSPIPYSGTATGALLLGFIAPFVGNWIRSEVEAKNKVLAKHGNALFHLLHEAVEKNQPIAVTLENRKWYVGFVTDSPNLDPLEQYFSLIPVLSGYRDPETLKVKETTFYDPVYEKIDKNKFAVTIPLDSVRVANFFDQEVYAKFFSETHKDDDEGKDTALGATSG